MPGPQGPVPNQMRSVISVYQTSSYNNEMMHRKILGQGDTEHCGL